MRSLTFEQLREANVARSDYYPIVVDPKRWALYLMAELGEYVQDLNDFEEGRINFTEFRDKARKEIPDMQTYLDLMATHLWIDLGQATIDKFNEVTNRIEGCSVYL